MKLFLDLEEVLIKDWYDPYCLLGKLDIIKSFCKQHDIKEAILFSAAVWNKEDIEVFNTEIRAELEGILSITLEPLKMDLAFQKICTNSMISIQHAKFVTDIFPINPKRDMFLNHILLEYGKIKDPEEFVLFDDTVQDSEFNQGNIKIIFKNI